MVFAITIEAPSLANALQEFNQWVYEKGLDVEVISHSYRPIYRAGSVVMTAGYYEFLYRINP